MHPASAGELEAFAPAQIAGLTSSCAVARWRSAGEFTPYRAGRRGLMCVDRSTSVREHGAERLLVATAAADLDNLRFYQRLGFRMLRIERDAFTPGFGYPEGLTVGGVPAPRPGVARARPQRKLSFPM